MRRWVRWLMAGALVLAATPAASASHQFGDVADGHTFHSEIEWLADQGITRGCNPPANTLFCPDDYVTRGQMAAFLNRALGLAPGSVSFADTGSHVFEADIAALAAAGITRGCDPPQNSRFCPDDSVTRGQMAAFLNRALELEAGGGGFSDTDGHTFEADIAALAAAGITRGCDPPANTRFCPDDYVTRGQMAAFLGRALGDGGDGPGPQPPPQPDPKLAEGLVVITSCRPQPLAQGEEEGIIRLDVVDPDRGEWADQRIFHFPAIEGVLMARNCGHWPQGGVADKWRLGWDTDYERMAIIRRTSESTGTWSIGYMEFDRAGNGTPVWVRTIAGNAGGRYPTRLFIKNGKTQYWWNVEDRLYAADDYGRGTVVAKGTDQCTLSHLWFPPENGDWVLCGSRVRVSPDGRWAAQEALNLPYTIPGQMHLWENPQVTIPETAAVVSLDENVVCDPVDWIDNRVVLCDDGFRVNLSADRTTGEVEWLVPESYRHMIDSMVLSPDRQTFAFEACQYGSGCALYRASVSGATQPTLILEGEDGRKLSLLEWR